MGSRFFFGLFNLFYAGYKEIQLRFYYGPTFHSILINEFDYYKSLPLSIKPRFLRTVRDNYEYFEFVPRGIEITRAMKVVIAGGAAQIGLFLPSESLSFFQKIIVYLDFYRSRITGRDHRGEVNPGLRIIVFSWSGIVAGLDKNDDGLNLLLHEFAHALWLEHKLTSNGVLDEETVIDFENLAKEEMNNVVDDEHHFFRKYAFSNVEEFFAVATENFFERPYLFRKQFPDLYAVLVKMLKQNPAKG